jgi:hypothetical protein
MAMDVRLSIAISRKISSSADRVDEWLGSLIGLLRNNLYILYLKHHGESESDIAGVLRIHPYVLKK